jgi:hypothetical protein
VRHYYNAPFDDLYAAPPALSNPHRRSYPYRAYHRGRSAEDLEEEERRQQELLESMDSLRGYELNPGGNLLLHPGTKYMASHGSWYHVINEVRSKPGSPLRKLQARIRATPGHEYPYATKAELKDLLNSMQRSRGEWWREVDDLRTFLQYHGMEGTWESNPRRRSRSRGRCPSCGCSR